MNNVSTETGLTVDEQLCMNALVEAHRLFSRLPVMHDSDITEFVLSLHRLQDLLAIRIARCNFPEGWTCTNKSEQGGATDKTSACEKEGKEIFTPIVKGIIDPLVGTMAKSELSKFIVETMLTAHHRGLLK